MKNRLMMAVAVGSLLVACASDPMITDRDVLVASNTGKLLPLYEQIKADLQIAKPNSDTAENRENYLAIVGKKIAQEKERVILNDLDRDINKHDIATLEAAIEKASDIKMYNEAVYTELTGQLQQGIEQKKLLIKSREKEFERLPDSKALEKVGILDEIAAIYGGSGATQIEIQKKAYIDGLAQNIQSLTETKRHEDAQVLLDNLEQIDPDYPGLADMRSGLISSEYEKQFWEALGEGQFVVAYETFKQLSRIPDYVQSNPDVMPIAEDIAQYFIDRGEKMMDELSIAAAYQAFSRARFMRRAMGKGDVYSEPEQEFITFVDKRLQKYADKEDYVPAFAYLSILEEMDQNHASVIKYSQKINNEMLGYATIKIIPAGFSETDSNKALGRGIVSKINQQLMEIIPTRVEVIDGTVAERNYSSAQVAEMQNPSSYYFLSGEILEANVDRVEKPASITKRVLTSYKRIENPDYVQWSELGKRDKKNTPEPPATIEVPVEEDVTIKKTIIEKHGVFSITYRLADAVTSLIVFSDAIDKTESTKSENIEGVEIGEFKQETIIAELSSDADILKKLADEVAMDAAKKIADQIKALEEAYIEKADQAVIAEDFNTAAANYAYRNILLQAQGKQDEEILANVRSYGIRWKE